MATPANLTRSVAVAVNYQKAPEHKFPIPFDDCFAGLEWVLGPLAYQPLIYPANDRHTETTSLVANATGHGLSRRTMAWLWELYLNGTDDDENPFAVPHRAAGVPVIRRDYEGMIHGFINQSVAIDAGYQLRRDLAEDILATLAQHGGHAH